MSRSSRIKLWISAVLLVLGVALLALPPQWIEMVLGAEPDGGNGELERLLGLVPVVVALGLAAEVWIRERASSLGRRGVPNE